jgi:hypothetical protein
LLIVGCIEIFSIIEVNRLEKFFDKAMNLAWKQIEAEEMKSAADQAKKADKKQF